MLRFVFIFILYSFSWITRKPNRTKEKEICFQHERHKQKFMFAWRVDLRLSTRKTHKTHNGFCIMTDKMIIVFEFVQLAQAHDWNSRIESALEMCTFTSYTNYDRFVVCLFITFTIFPMMVKTFNRLTQMHWIECMEQVSYLPKHMQTQ